MEREVTIQELPEAVRGIVEARTGDAVFVVGPDYRVVYWDENMQTLTGMLSEDMVGRRCYEVVLGEGGSGTPICTYGCSVMNLSRAGLPVSSYDMRIKTVSGQRRWVNVSNLSVDCGEGPYIVHLLRDSQGTHEALEMARGLIRLSSKEESVRERRGMDSRDVPALTSRQLEVLRLIAKGNTVKEISKSLYLSEATVRNHVGAVLQALGAHSQLEAVAKARELGLLG